MNNIYRDEIIGKVIFFIVGIYILLKIFIPLVYPVSVASDISYDRTEIYQQLIDKSNACIETAMDYSGNQDEDRKELFSIVFKYITSIDISNPTTYLTSQIPILQLIDITSITSEENGPVVVVPRETLDTKPQEQNADNTGTTNPGESNTNPPADTVNPSNFTAGDDNYDEEKLNDSDKKNTQPNDNNSSPGQEVVPGRITPLKKLKLDPSKPLILIFHTHTTENYNPDNLKDQNFTTDPDKGVCRAGEELKKELQNTYGIATIHDTTVHDIPVREKGYSKSRPTIEKYLKKYPSLKIIIDLHRDGNIEKDRTTAIIKDEKYARVMFVIGANNKNHAKSEATAKRINDIFEYLYPNFSRGLLYKKAVYNQDLSSKIVLIELGSDENSLNEALRSVKVIARVLAECIK